MYPALPADIHLVVYSSREDAFDVCDHKSNVWKNEADTNKDGVNKCMWKDGANTFRINSICDEKCVLPGTIYTSPYFPAVEYISKPALECRN